MACVEFKLRLLRALIVRTAVVLTETIVHLLGWIKHPLRSAKADFHIFKRRPPNPSTHTAVKGTWRNRRMDLFKKITMVVMLPVFVHGSQVSLESDLSTYVGTAGFTKGILNTKRLPAELKQ